MAELLEARAAPGSMLPLPPTGLNAALAAASLCAPLSAASDTSQPGAPSDRLDSRPTAGRPSDSTTKPKVAKNDQAGPIIDDRSDGDLRSDPLTIGWNLGGQIDPQIVSPSLPAAQRESASDGDDPQATLAKPTTSGGDGGGGGGTALKSAPMVASNADGTSMGTSPSPSKGGGGGGGGRAAEGEQTPATADAPSSDPTSGSTDDSMVGAADTSGTLSQPSPEAAPQAATAATIVEPFPADLGNWNVTQLGGSQSGRGDVTVESGTALLGEGDSYSVSLSTTFVVPAGAQTVSFEYSELSFDTTATNSIHDAFEVELVDEQDVPLVVAHQSGRTSFFNATEGAPLTSGPGVDVTSDQEGSAQVTVDVSGIPADTVATLRFRLVNNDGDDGTSVRILTVGLPTADQVQANDDQFTVAEDSGTTNLDVLGNDDLTFAELVSVSAGSAGGRVSIVAGQTVDYTPAKDFFGQEVFSYTISDTATNTLQSAEVTVTVTPVNDPPTANDDTYVVSARDSSAVLDVLVNDTVDPDEGESLTIISVTQGSHGGALSIEDGKRIVYSPGTGFTGTETFTYTIEDGTAGSTDSATVTARVEGQPVQLTVANLHGNEGQQLTLTGTFSDPVNAQPHTVVIDWGDGSSAVAFTDEQQGSGNVLARHVYADDGVYTIEMRVIDSVGNMTSTTSTATIGNVDPLLVSADPLAIEEGSEVRLNLATLTDPGFSSTTAGTQETFTATIDWGDSSPSGTATVSVAQGSEGKPTIATIFGHHSYVDDGLYTVTVTAQDDDSGSSTTTVMVQVENAAPRFLTGVGPRAPVSQPLGLQATFSDRGLIDVHAAEVDWGGGLEPAAITEESGIFTVSASHQYDAVGEYPVLIRVKDNAGASAELMVMANATPPTDTNPPVGVLITPSDGSTVLTDLGYIDVQWSDDVALDALSFDASDVTINGVMVTDATVDASIIGLGSLHVHGLIGRRSSDGDVGRERSS